MDLIPLPHKITPGEGFFIISHETTIKLDMILNNNDFETAKILQQQINSITALELPIGKVLRKEHEKIDNCILLEFDDTQANQESYKLVIADRKIEIIAGSTRGFMYGVATLVQICKTSITEIECMEIYDKPSYMNRGYMLDVSRGRVPTMKNVKTLVDQLALYKINQLQLYMENFMRIDGLEEIWSQTDPFTAEEVMELDSYCIMRGIELVPCIATFGHLYDLLRTESFNKYREMDAGVGEPFTWYHRMRYHIIDISNPESLGVITTILDKFFPLFRSDKINICCDETFDLGKGKSSSMTGKMSHGEMYLSFVNQLIGYMQGKGKEVMIWADIIQNHPESLDKLNNQVTCLNWYYNYDAKDESAKMLHEQNIKHYVCPSVSGYSRLVNAYDLSFTNIREMAKLGSKYNAQGFLNTEWGDTGHINMAALSIPGMIYGAAQSWNVDDERTFDDIDEVISLLEFGDKGKKIVGLLRDLSNQDLVIFNDFAFFRDYKVYNLEYHDFGMCLYEKSRDVFKQATEERLKKAVNRSKEILQSIRQTVVINNNQQNVFNELCLSARGVALMQEFALVIKKCEYEQNVKLLETPCELAIKLEYWLADYCEAWRKVSRESELYRIKEFFHQMCRILRKYEVK